MISVGELLTRFPSVPWREPITITTTEGSSLHCRICIAQVGLKAQDLRSLTDAEFEAHIAEAHGI